MAVNNDKTNKLYAVNDTGVKFFSSLTRALAKGTETFIYNGSETYITSFPGAICFVSDDKGNSIFLNKLLFGDGAHAASADSGGSGESGITEVTLDMIPVITKDGETLKSLADYFNVDGEVITESLNITNASGDTIISLTKDGIKINDKSVALIENVNSALEDAKSYADAVEQSAKEYAAGLLSSVYIIKGTLEYYSDLSNVSNPKSGWVYNIKNAYGNKGESNYIPPGTNYVYVDDGTNKYWDALGGTIDLSGFATILEAGGYATTAKEEAEDYTDRLVGDLKDSVDLNASNIQNISNNLDNYESRISTNESNISTNTESIKTNTSNISQNTTNITNISTQLTWQ